MGHEASKATIYFFPSMFVHMGMTYDIVWAMAPATPPHSRLTCVFRTRTSGLSRDGFPRSSGKWASPRLFNVPNVKKENPGRNKKINKNSVHTMHILKKNSIKPVISHLKLQWGPDLLKLNKCKLDNIYKNIQADLLIGFIVECVIDKSTIHCILYVCINNYAK